MLKSSQTNLKLAQLGMMSARDPRERGHTSQNRQHSTRAVVLKPGGGGRGAPDVHELQFPIALAIGLAHASSAGGLEATRGQG